MTIVIFETEQWEAATCARLAGDHALDCTPRTPQRERMPTSTPCRCRSFSPPRT